jgi:nucleotide-binding universal stress UspA family protein
MQKLFNKVLVPFDFSERSRRTVQSAISLAAEYECSIYLLHASLTFTVAGDAEIGRKFEETLAEYDPALRMTYAIAHGGWNESVISFIHQNNIDLLLTGQAGRLFRGRAMAVNPNRIAARTNIPVITVPANRRLSKLGSIVIPVTDFLPVRKLIYGIYMASKYSTTVKLLGVENEETSQKVRYYLKKAYQLIRDNCSLNVQLELTSGNNVAEAINNHAMIQSADLVIVNPGNQTRMPGLFSSMLGNIIQKYSVPPVLTVNPE